MGKQNTDSGLPRREPGQTMEVVEHTHPGLDPGKPHRHRMGQIPHDHDAEGRPVVNAEAKFTPAGPVVSPPDDDTDPTLVTGNAGVDILDKVAGEREGSTGNAGRAGEPESRERTAVASEGTPATTEVIPAPGGNFSNPTAAARNDLAQPTRSIGTVIANSAMDAAHGIPAEVQDETTHSREAVNLLIVAAAEYHRHPHYRLMPETMLLDLEVIVQHMVQARGLKS